MNTCDKPRRVQDPLGACEKGVNLEAPQSRACVLQKIEIGERQIAAGETTSHEDPKHRLQKWLA